MSKTNWSASAEFHLKQLLRCLKAGQFSDGRVRSSAPWLSVRHFTQAKTYQKATYLIAVAARIY